MEYSNIAILSNIQPPLVQLKWVDPRSKTTSLAAPRPRAAAPSLLGAGVLAVGLNAGGPGGLPPGWFLRRTALAQGLPLV